MKTKVRGILSGPQNKKCHISLLASTHLSQHLMWNFSTKNHRILNSFLMYIASRDITANYFLLCKYLQQRTCIKCRSGILLRRKITEIVFDWKSYASIQVQSSHYSGLTEAMHHNTPDYVPIISDVLTLITTINHNDPSLKGESWLIWASHMTTLLPRVYHDPNW